MGETSHRPKSLLEAVELTKRFGSLVANDRVSLAIRAGETHALLGENGAGKSTLVKMLCGLLQPDSGELLYEGVPVVFPDPASSRARGVGVVFQHFALFDAMTVVENVALGLPGHQPLSVLAARIDACVHRYGLEVEPYRRVGELSVGERQRVEIVRCLLGDPRVLILDEPTSVLTPDESENLFRTVDLLTAEGRAVLFISHKLDEVRRLCHRATVLRGGRFIAEVDPQQESFASLARLMVGADVPRTPRAATHALGEPRLLVRHLNLAGDGSRGSALHDINLEIRAGEIVGIAGVAGNGQTALFDVLSGERTVQDRESIVISTVPAGGFGPTERRALRAGFVPEERLGHAAAPDLCLSDNVLLTTHGDGQIVTADIIRRSPLFARFKQIVKGFDVRFGGKDPKARRLSGGNLQKFVIGREVLRDPVLIVVDQPTWGVDASAAAFIRTTLRQRAAEGCAVLVVSQDLDELLEFADRIAVMSEGRLTEPVPVEETSREAIGLAMGGAHRAAGEGSHAA
ncbi:ABC transporter ATP-binding protein [Ancylobacter dichloromethanicus]|uniref:ABC transporter ATP-binding protein n=1 Tax=Ancylobacter dichloromethanicus TaxID=518825 RepID=A0A9W6J744_9HYPH|nr:ABC transporter ATP-binding protein [Ancylobacter dichloromethanicus]MBS7554458.1 ABC transporter ATP-binding protein [Ancylobacter dichloromethanicus]GLK71587.1 ABC transporter ATP-binding protein [Ancylobacter dichloromethanicus]